MGRLPQASYQLILNRTINPESGLWATPGLGQAWLLCSAGTSLKFCLALSIAIPNQFPRTDGWNCLGDQVVAQALILYRSRAESTPKLQVRTLGTFIVWHWRHAWKKEHGHPLAPLDYLRMPFHLFFMRE